MQCTDFDITDDSIALEETEMFSWTLMVQGSPELVTLGDNSATDVLILDDDGKTHTQTHTRIDLEPLSPYKKSFMSIITLIHNNSTVPKYHYVLIC